MASRQAKHFWPQQKQTLDFPSRKDEHHIEMSSVLKMYFQLDPNIGMTSARVVVMPMDLINFKIIEKFA